MIPRKVEKPWGYELIYAETEKYAGKVIFVQKGHQLSLQYHKVKDETMYLYKGLAQLELRNTKGQSQVIELSPGNSYHIKPGCQHRVTALEDCEILEVSTPELDDVVRLEDRYGRV
jgi:mannose-6-phosphate isomerase-like protein (cupin superfamily)